MTDMPVVEFEIGEKTSRSLALCFSKLQAEGVSVTRRPESDALILKGTPDSICSAFAKCGVPEAFTTACKTTEAASRPHFYDLAHWFKIYGIHANPGCAQDCVTREASNAVTGFDDSKVVVRRYEV